MKNNFLKLKELKKELKTINYLILNDKELDLTLSINIDINKKYIKKHIFDIYGDNYRILKSIRTGILREISKYETMDNDRIMIYTDGSTLPTNPGNMGIGSLTIDQNGNEYQLTRYAGKGTNNLAELLSVIISILQLPFGSKIKIITDSKYVYNGISRWIDMWEKSEYVIKNGDPVKNKKYWKIISKIKNFYDVKASWIRSHQDDEFFNNMADKLAKYSVYNKDIKEKENDIEYIYNKINDFLNY